MLPGPGYVDCVLIGRRQECARIDALLEAGRRSSAGALVLLGEPGAGKTALLNYAAESAEGMRVLRAVGFESETDLEFSALVEVCRPLVGYFGQLPETTRGALESALGLRPQPVAGDRFLVGVAMLALLRPRPRRYRSCSSVTTSNGSTVHRSTRFCSRCVGSTLTRWPRSWRRDPTPHRSCRG